jgi:hypothetical protein
MFVRLFYTLRKYGVPVTTRELIDLNQAVASGLVLQIKTSSINWLKLF